MINSILLRGEYLVLVFHVTNEKVIMIVNVPTSNIFWAKQKMQPSLFDKCWGIKFQASM